MSMNKFYYEVALRDDQLFIIIYKESTPIGTIMFKEDEWKLAQPLIEAFLNDLNNASEPRPDIRTA